MKKVALLLAFILSFSLWYTQIKIATSYASALIMQTEAKKTRKNSIGFQFKGLLGIFDRIYVEISYDNLKRTTTAHNTS